MTSSEGMDGCWAVEDNMRWYRTSSKAQYVGQCDSLRRAGDEEAWKQMMDAMEPITMKEFMASTDFESFVEAEQDPDIPPERLLTEMILGDPESGFYRSNWKGTPAYFMQTSGFEFIFA